MIKYHYVYRITNKTLNKHYYGVRSSKVEPKLDLGIKYFSSSTDKDFIKDQNENPDNFKYKVIRNFESRKDALCFEINLHNKFDVSINESFYNLSKQTSTGFDTTGISMKKPQLRDMVMVTDGKKCFRVSNTDKRYLSGELKMINKDKVIIKTDNGYKSITKKEFESGNYEFMFKNTVSVIDENGKKFRMSKEDFNKNPDIHGHTKGKFVAVDIYGNKYHICKTDSRYLSGELIAESKGRKWTTQQKENIMNERSKRKWLYNDKLKKTLFTSNDLEELFEDGWNLGRKFYK